MKSLLRCCLFASLLPACCAEHLLAATPANLDARVDGRPADAAEPLATDAWHTITARYRYAGDFTLLTNTFMILCPGTDRVQGFDVNYHLPSNRLAIIKHGSYNATAATGQPGQAGKIIENDQGYLDCEHTTVEKTADTLAVAYRLKFKKNVLQGACNVFLYIEDKQGNYDGFTSVGTVTIDRETAVCRTDMPTSWENALRPTGKAAAAIVLADKGKAAGALVIPRNPKEIETKAAHDLARHFKLISGADLPIIGDDVPTVDGSPLISIGRTRLLESSGCQWKDADLAAEGYAIEVLGNRVYLYGGSGRGLLNGVYSLLEEDLGCRWYAVSSIDTPHREKFAVRLVPRRFVPVLELRDLYVYSMWDPTWSLRNKANTPNARIPLAWGGSLRFHNAGHTAALYFPPQQYFAKHPEYYALVNGQRQPSQLCQTNEDVIRLTIEKTCQIFRDHPEATITAITPNDGRGFCDCPHCKKLNDENGGRSGSYFYYINRVAAGVKKEFPDRHLIAYAYSDYAKAPTTFKVDPYTIVWLCTDSHSWMYQFCFVWESEQFRQIIKAWQAARAKFYIWDYTGDYVHSLVPLANWPVVAGNTRFNIRSGAAGVMYEGNATDNDEMRAWVGAKLLWNPGLDTKSLLKDFVFGYYKESAQPLWDYQRMMWDYWERWHRRPHRCGVPYGDNPLVNNLHCSYAPDGPMFTPDFMARMRADFTAAEKLAKSADILARVKKAKLSLLYLELSQQLGYYTEFGDFRYGRNVREPRAARQRFKPYLEEFCELYRKNRLSALGDPVTFESITAKWRSCIDTVNPAPPRVALPGEWIFAADAEDKGVKEKWYAQQKFYDAAARMADPCRQGEPPAGAPAEGLARLHVDRGIGWQQQGFPGLAGYGWYFQNFEVPDELLAKNHLYLWLRGVNEQAWVYVNDAAVFERTYASTGKSAGDLDGGFRCDIKKYLRPGVKNRIAVRVTHCVGLGGMCLPAMLVGTAESCSTEQLDQYRF